MGWENSTRKLRLPANWESEIRPAVLRRDNYICQRRVPGGICGAPANQVDHKDRYGGDEMDNLQALCQKDHSVKSASEGGQAWGAMRRQIAAKRYRPQPVHPGLRKAP